MIFWIRAILLLVTVVVTITSSSAVNDTITINSNDPMVVNSNNNNNSNIQMEQAVVDVDAPVTTTTATTTTATTTTATNTEIRWNVIYPSIRIFAMTLTGLAVVGTIYCIIWLYQHRKERIIQAHQPEFLFVIGGGILLWEISVIPYSLDDSIISARGCSIACVTNQWLYNIGFTISFAGLYSKLWRINQIFHNPQFRRISVTVADVLKPFAILFSYTFIILVVWTIIDPPHWERIRIDETYTYGSCQSNRTGQSLEGLLFTGHVVVVLATIRQAYMARNVSSEFSETWPLALGLLNWIQLSIIGIPVRQLIDDIVPSASYFLGVSILLAQSLTILFAIFCPLYLHPSIRHPPPALGHTIRVTRTEHPNVNITPGTTMIDSSIHNENEIYHNAVIEHLNNGSSISTSNPTTSEKSVNHHPKRPLEDNILKSKDNDRIHHQPPQETVFAPIAESSSEMIDSSTSMNIDIATNGNSSSNLLKEEEEETA